MIRVDGVEGAGLPGDDPGLLTGLCCFETLRTYGSRWFRAAAHLERLAGSARALGIPWPGEAALRAELEAVRGPDVRARLLLTAGGHLVTVAGPVDPARVGAPLRLGRLPWRPLPGLPGAVKHTGRAAWVLAARRQGVDEVLLVDPGGEVLEASRSGLVAARDGVLVVPPLDGRRLPSVTLQALLEAAAEAGLPLRRAALRLEEDYAEFYACSTLKELAPAILAPGESPRSGPLGAALHAAFRRLAARECGAGSA